MAFYSELGRPGAAERGLSDGFRAQTLTGSRAPKTLGCRVWRQEKGPTGRAARASTCLAALRAVRGGLGAAGWRPGGEARPTWARAPPAQSPPGVQPGRPRGGAEGRRAGAGGGGCCCRGEWSAARRFWLGRVAGVTAALAMRTLWMVLCALARLWPGALAGCAEAGRCCPGRDPACFARGWRLDRVYGTCFCDQACRLTGDCCFDYDRACPGGWLGPGWGGAANRATLDSGERAGRGAARSRESSGCF